MPFELQPSRKAALASAILCMALVYLAIGFMGAYADEGISSSLAGRMSWALLIGIMVYFAFREADLIISLVRGQKVHDVALLLAFISTISLPIINSYFPMDTGFKSTEKRALAVRPEFRFSELVEFPKAFDSYYGDNFGFRNLLVNWNNVLHAKHLGVAAVQGKVVMGKEGWMYLAGLQIDDYKCIIPFSEDELQKSASSLIQRRDYFRAMGVPFYFIVIPNKATIYPEYLPDSVKRSGDGCRFDQLIGYMSEHTDLNIIDVRKALIEAKRSERAYHKTDTHWNEHGAFLAYVRLIDEMADDAAGLSRPSMDEMEVLVEEGPGGDLAHMLGLGDRMREQRINVRPKSESRAVEIKDIGYMNPNPVDMFSMRLFEVPDKRLPRLLMLRDSFADYLIPYLKEDFSRSLYLWVYHLTPEIIEKEKPDVVVMEMVERHLGFLTYDAYDGSYFGAPDAEGLAGAGMKKADKPAADADGDGR